MADHPFLKNAVVVGYIHRHCDDCGEDKDTTVFMTKGGKFLAICKECWPDQ